MAQSSYVHLEGCYIVHDTLKALLVRYNGEEHWIPRSVVSNGDNFEKGDKDVTISIPARFAEQNDIEVES